MRPSVRDAGGATSLATAPFPTTSPPNQPGPAETARPRTGAAQLWINNRYRTALADAKLDDFTALMATTEGRLMRALPDRENWWLRLHAPHGGTRGAFLKKHHVRSLPNWIRAKLAPTARTWPGGSRPKTWPAWPIPASRPCQSLPLASG